MQQLLKLRDGLNGKMDYDPDSGEITILYSFLHDREFEDFRFTTSRPSSDGILNLPSDGKATHTVKFSEFAVEATLHVQRRPFGAYFQTTSGISGSYDTSGTGGVVLRGPAFRDRWIPSPNQFQRGGAIPCHFQVQGGTARFQLGNTSAAQPVNRTTPAQVQLSGGSKGAGFADLVIRGTVDETWLAFYEIPGEAGDD